MKVIQEEIFVLSASMLIPLLDEIRSQTQLFRKLSDFITELGKNLLHPQSLGPRLTSQFLLNQI